MAVEETKRLGEVVASSTSQFTAQCYQLFEPPALGELVRAGSSAVYGVVCHVATEPLDPGRRILARGEGAASEEEVYRNNPQLSRLLHTRFQAMTVGYKSGDGVRQHLPPVPPRIHAFVHACADDEVARFTQCTDFLHILLASNLPMVDEVVVACLRRAAGCHADPQAFLVAAGKALTAELAGQMPRLNSILRGLRP